MDYFELYQIPVSFQVDAAALRRIYYENNKKFHPDFHTLADPVQQAEMLEKATLNNEAFQTLSDPDRRMRYILELEGLLQEENRRTLPPDFLMEMMDLNETMMELELDFDAGRYAAALRELEQLEQNLEQGIRPVLERYRAETGARSELEAVLEYYLKKRYLLRIRENLSKFAAL